LVEAKVKHLPVPKDEEPAQPKRGQVINLMDALRKSVQNTETAPAVAKKKLSTQDAASLFPDHEEKGGLALVKSSAKTTRASSAGKAKAGAKRKSA
jgi:DNA end-binding protein Ku